MVARRLLAIVLALALPAVPIASLFVDWRIGGGEYSGVGYAVFALGALISVMNLYFSFLRPNLLRVLASDPRNARNISVAPLIGMLTVPGLALVAPSASLSIACLALILADTGNVFWFVLSAWGDESFWRAG